MAEVEEIIADARNFASESFGNAQGLVSTAVSIANSIAFPQFPVFPSVRPMPSIPETTPPPDQYPTLRPTGPRPGSPSLQPAYRPSLPDFGAIPRPERLEYSDLFAFEPPDITLPPAPQDIPEMGEYDFPDVPLLSMPETPALAPINFPDAPSVSIPTLDLHAPERPTEAPPDARQLVEVSYNRVLPEMREYLEQQVDAFTARISPEHAETMAQLERRLSEITEGGTAMPAHLEQAIYDRTRRRTEAQRREAEAEAWEASARRGFTLPPGVLQAALQRASRQGHEGNVAAASEVAIEMARLEQQNIQFAVQTSTALRQVVLNSALQWAGTLVQINGQAVQYAQAIAQAALDGYNARLALFQSEVSLFQAEAQVYEVQLRAAFADLERYQALLNAEQLKAQVNGQLIQQYREQISGERAKIDLYTAELQGVSARLDADRAQIEAFGMQVRAYMAQVQGKEAELRVYTAAMEGDRTKVQAFASQVEAFRSEVQAIGAQVAAETTYAEAINSYNRTAANVFASEMQAYGIDVGASTSIYDSEIRRFLAQLDRYRASLESQRIAFQSNLEGVRLEHEQARTIYETQAQIGIETARLYLQRAQNASGAAISGASVYANIAAAAVSAQNTMVSLSRELLDDD